MKGETVLRIGELSKRSGVSPELLRAWERRYGLLRPVRSGGGLRLYSLEDLERGRLMGGHIGGGGGAGARGAAPGRRGPPAGGAGAPRPPPPGGGGPGRPPRRAPPRSAG